MAIKEGLQHEHDGHRQKMKNKYLKLGIDSFDEHEILEILLFYAIPRKDTNLIAHKLINKFGSFAGVLDAPYDLLKEYGLTDNAAFLLKMLTDVMRYYKQNKENDTETKFELEMLPAFFINQFSGKTKEMVYLMLLDPKFRRVYTGIIGIGNLKQTDLNITRVCELAVQYKAAYVVIAHNHPSGSPLPSDSDIISTIHLKQALKTLKVSLLDHFIVTENDCTSMADSQLLFNSLEEYKNSFGYSYYSQI